MQLTDDTDTRIRKCFAKVCKRLDKVGFRYDPDDIFRYVVIVNRNFGVAEICDAIITAREIAREQAELN